MSEKALKIVPAPESRTSPDARTETSNAKGLFARIGRKRLRMILLVGLPLYLDRQRLCRRAKSPDHTGYFRQDHQLAIREGQHVNPGDELFSLDREPFALALAQVKAKLDTARSDFDKLKSNLKSLNTLAELAEKNVDLKQRDVDRKTKLVSSQAGSQADLDTALAAVITAKLQAEFAVQQRDTTLNQLLGDPDLPLERFPEYAQAKAALDNAQRDFDHTIVRAPMSGTATQVDNIQLGRFVAAGTPVLSVIDD